MSQVVSSKGIGARVRQTDTLSTCCNSLVCQSSGGHFVLLLPSFSSCVSIPGWRHQGGRFVVKQITLA